MHRHYGSKFLIDSLNSPGFYFSDTEVKKFEMSAAQTKGTAIPGLTPGHFVQYIADNVDHNVCTLDGQNTFHCAFLTFQKTQTSSSFEIMQISSRLSSNFRTTRLLVGISLILSPLLRNACMCVFLDGCMKKYTD